MVIGGGYCGSTFAFNLAPACKEMDVEIVILEKQTFIFHAIAGVRALVNSSWVKKLFIPHNCFDKLPNVKIIQAQADAVSETSVTYRKVLEDGTLSETSEECEFTYLVLATGSLYPSPIKPVVGSFTQKAVEEAYTSAYEKIKEAKRVLIIGGGAVGCEVAGEIKFTYPEKKVQLIDSNETLLARPNLKDKFRKKLLKEMTKMDIDVLLKERLEERLDVSSYETKTLTTVSGTTLESDVQLVCAGTRPANEFLKSLGGDDILDYNGLIRVKSNFQLKNEQYERIFAIGDASDHPTPKMAYWGVLQGAHLAKHLANHLKKKGRNLDMPPFQQVKTEAIMVPLGPMNGVSQLPMFGGMVMGSTTTKLIKSTDLFVNQFFKQFKAPVPGTPGHPGKKPDETDPEGKTNEGGL